MRPCHPTVKRVIRIDRNSVKKDHTVTNAMDRLKLLITTNANRSNRLLGILKIKAGTQKEILFHPFWNYKMEFEASRIQQMPSTQIPHDTATPTWELFII